MKRIFIINPVAGKRDAGSWLISRIRCAAETLGEPEPEIIVTQHAGHAAEVARRWAAQPEPVALYACGGDGTLNEVIQGAANHPQVAVGCVPCGSGNDYVRNFGTEEGSPFLDMQAQLRAGTARVDLLETSLGLGVDICAAGLDAQVAYGIPKYRRLPGCGGTMAYTFSIVETMFRHFGHALRVTLDGKTENGTYMMAALCNGRFYGGGYMAAPYASMDDGVLDVILVKPVPRLRIASLLAQYKSGAHLQPDGTVSEALRPYMTFCRAREVRMEVLDSRPLIATVDGECAPVRQLFARTLPGALTVLLPQTILHAAGISAGVYPIHTGCSQTRSM